MAVLWIIALVALLAWAAFTQIGARQQVDVAAAMSEQDASNLVLSRFNVTWGQTEGPGHLNFRPRLRYQGPTLSFSFSPTGPDSCDVSIWTSHWTSRLGIMSHAQIAWRKKRSVAAALGNGVQAGPQLTRGTEQ